MSNLLKAIKNLIEDCSSKIINSTPVGKNRMNSMGDALEIYIQDVFANSIGMNEVQRKTNIKNTFSYIGNTNNPPDAILKNGDAIEIKKVQNPRAALALNSSYPKAKLYANSTLISKACRECENWDVKDIIYVVGYTDDSRIKYLWFVYGDCFSAHKDIYERIKNTISSGISNIQDVEFSDTKELGKVKKVDPLGVTDLRIRGMWHIENPHKIFSYLEAEDFDFDFQLFCIMKIEKFNSFSDLDRNALQNLKMKNYLFTKVEIKNPDNPAQYLDCIFLNFKSNLS